MNKRKVLSILASCLFLILVIMTSVPIYNGGRRMQWVYLFRDFNKDGSPYVIFDIIFMVAAFVLVALSFIIKKRAKLFITLSVVSTWVSGTVMAIQTMFHTEYGIIPLICYAVLCAPVLIWNLVLKNDSLNYNCASATVSPSATSVSRTQPQAAKRSFFSKLFGAVAGNSDNALATQNEGPAYAPAAPAVSYNVQPAYSKKDKVLKTDEAKNYYNYVIEALRKKSAENNGNNAFVNREEIACLAASKFGINFNLKDKSVRKDKENKSKLKVFNKTLCLFEGRIYNNGKIEIGMSPTDYTGSESEIERFAQAEISEFSVKIKPEMETVLKQTEIELSDTVSQKFEMLSNDEKERFFATLSQETNDRIQIYTQKSAVVLFGFATAMQRLNEKYGIENGCVQSAIAKAITEIYIAGNHKLRTALGEFVCLQLDRALSGLNANVKIPVLYSVIARIMNYRKFKGETVEGYTELPDAECNDIIDGLLLRAPNGERLTPQALREYCLKDILDDTDIAAYNKYQFEDGRDPVYILQTVSTFIKKYVVNNNYLVNSIYLMDGTLNYYYEKLCKADKSASQTEPVGNFKVMLADIYYSVQNQSGKTLNETAEQRCKERKEKILAESETTKKE